MAMNVGDLIHAGSLQSLTVTRGTAGSFAETWATIRSPYIAIAPKSGDETWFSESVRAQMTHQITMRAGTIKVTSRMRLLWNSRYFNFLSVMDTKEQGKELKIAAIENLDVTETGAAMSSIPFTFTTPELDFLATALANSQTYDPVTDKRIYTETVKLICTQLTGVIVTQPSASLGITGDVTRILNKAATTQLTAVNTSQEYDTLAVGTGETDLIARAGGATGPTIYRGVMQTTGWLIG